MKRDFEGKHPSVKILLSHIATDLEHLAFILGSATTLSVASGKSF